MAKFLLTFSLLVVSASIVGTTHAEDSLGPCSPWSPFHGLVSPHLSVRFGPPALRHRRHPNGVEGAIQQRRRVRLG